MINLQ
jgi:hypothetical protein